MAGTLRIRKQSITEMDVDCIVNAANRQLRHGGGVCGAIFAAAGARELEAACDALGHCPTGEAVITPGFKLKAKYIVHAVGPIWQGGSHNEGQLLYRCYQNTMKVACAKGCRSIAFPLISSGIYGYPVKEAWRVAIKAIQESPYEMDVTIAVIDDWALQLGASILSQEAKTASPTW
ncbi:MAG: macro domain-containing protein [Clostridiales bacterium]|nr:macro domain-containing protein [Clostridiales bacterium]